MNLDKIKRTLDDHGTTALLYSEVAVLIAAARERDALRAEVERLRAIVECVSDACTSDTISEVALNGVPIKSAARAALTRPAARGEV